jgi:septal ring factor EnvC (AmiA/AmiB activator)
MDMATTSKSVDWLEVGWKVLAVLILPVLGIGVSMYTEASLTREKIAQVQRRLDEDRTQIESVNARINQISLTVQDTNGQIRELRTVLDIIRTQVTRTSEVGRP